MPRTFVVPCVQWCADGLSGYETSTGNVDAARHVGLNLETKSKAHYIASVCNVCSDMRTVNVTATCCLSQQQHINKSHLTRSCHTSASALQSDSDIQHIVLKHLRQQAERIRKSNPHPCIWCGCGAFSHKRLSHDETDRASQTRY